MIRGTVNETTQTVAKDAVHLSEGYELVLSGASEGAAVTSELQESDPSKPAFFTTLPSGDHNGPTE